MKLAGIYPITDDAFMDRPGHEDAIDAVAGAGIAMLQFRARHGNRDKARRQASHLLAVCRKHGVPLIVNDDVELCKSIGAEGVHLGTADSDISDARRILGPKAVIGATCHASLELALSARKQGADYVAFGRFFPSMSKPGASPAQPKILSAARESLDLPIAAIGGINTENAGLLLDAGADLLAVIQAIFGAADPGAAASELVRIHAALPER